MVGTVAARIDVWLHYPNCIVCSVLDRPHTVWCDDSYRRRSCHQCHGPLSRMFPTIHSNLQPLSPFRSPPMVDATRVGICIVQLDENTSRQVSKSQLRNSPPCA